MGKLPFARAAALFTAMTFGQGQINFSTKVGADVDAPVVFAGSPQGVGPDWSAQLYLRFQNGSLSPLVPAPTFRSGAANPIATRYVVPVDPVIVPGIPPGNPATVVMRAWLTCNGSFEAAKASGGGYGESAPLTIPSLGGGLLPDSNLSGLEGFVIGFPEPSTITLAVLGGSLLLLSRRK